MENIRIQIIYDNAKEHSALQEGWGFSALIEAGEQTILFDTGNDQEAFFSNIEKMGIDCANVTDVIFSHKHKDHITGYKEILAKVKKSCLVYIPKGFSLKKAPSYLQIKKVSDFIEIGENLFSFVLRGGLFLYEQSLVLRAEKGLVVITGCAHPGIIKILETAQTKGKAPLYLVLGGFHLFRKNSSFVAEIICKFQSLGVKKVAPCHCCGEAAIEQLQKAYGENFLKIGTGSVVTV